MSSKSSSVARHRAVRLSALLCRSALLLSLGLPVAFAQTKDPATVFTPVDPASAGFDAQGLTDLDELFAGEVDEGKLVGCLALVARGEKVVYCGTFGDRDREAQETMTEDTIFRIYSMSKPITSVAVMMLVERGEVDLDAPISKYLPVLANLKVAGKGDDGEETEVDPTRKVTVRDLLRHTSGFTYGLDGDTPVDRRYRAVGILWRQSNLEALVEELAKLPLLHQPGTRFHYSVSTDVLGRLVEVVSEQSFAEFLDENVFGPLGMVDTFFTVPADKRDRFAQMYQPEKGGGLIPAPPLDSWRFLNENEFYSGGGGLCSTTRDYLRFAQMLANGGALGDERLLEQETIEEMTSDQLKDIPSSGGFQFGLGVWIDGQGRYGWGGAAGTRFWVDPKHKVIGLFMVQIKPYRGANYERQMKSLVYRALTD
jgi:CubicO group peptidase (beta-lactamase class C family)